ncbi:rod shape-determining protein MreC [Candidatus Falkowbacteria bacterium]|nr:MAG: rod shape-determining protein MreC [Candidatus Falkowbacteria bacterium]
MQQKKSLLTFIAMAVIAIFLVIGQQINILKPINEGMSQLLSPFVRLTYWFGDIFSTSSDSEKNLDQLQNEVSRLTTENNTLIVENARVAEIEQENITLRKFLDFFNASPRLYVISNVIARGLPNSFSQQQSITLDHGSLDGITIGMPIVDNEGVLLGKITETKDHISQGCLLFDNSCRIAVAIQGQPETIGVIQSDLSLTLKIDFIPHSQQISENQIVVTSGLEEGMPAGLVIGRINQVIKDGNELWQHALVKPISNFTNIKIVTVIK